MATVRANMHEVLGPYLSSSSLPTSVSAPTGTQMRLPVAPGGAVPSGLRPIPTTTQTNKKTNVQIPYMRRATDAQGVAGVWGPSVSEGSMALVERQIFVPYNRGSSLGVNSFVDVYSVEQVNETIKQPRQEKFTYKTFPYRLDGVVNNVDGDDDTHEFRDSAVVNVAIQGHCRLDHREKFRADQKLSQTSTTIYLGLFATRIKSNEWVHHLERFSSSMITHKLIEFGDEMGGMPGDGGEGNGGEGVEKTKRILLFAWVVGLVVDTSQSRGMLTIKVDVRPLQPIVDDDIRHEQNYVKIDGKHNCVLRWKRDGRMKVGCQIVPDIIGDVVVARTVESQLNALWGAAT